MNPERLFRPRTIAVYGGKWSDYVVEQCRKLGFEGEIWRVHPERDGCFRSTGELPAAPDSAFLGINRELSIVEAAALSERGAGGAVVFARGFAEVEDGQRATRRLNEAAGDMPFIGPNCYGFANFFDGAALWPDQVVGRRVARGVAILGQSGTVCITLMYQRRSLPTGYVITMGNQQRLTCAELIRHVADDERVSAIGMYLESVGDVDAFAGAVDHARRRGKPLALVKVGRSAKGRDAAFSHTGSLTGSDVLHDALFERLGVARCDSLAELTETLKLFHCHGPLPSNHLAVLGASGGDMAMASDLARGLAVEFPPPSPPARGALDSSTGPGVRIDNPLDFQTGTWFDGDKMRRMFAAMLRSGHALTAFMLDPPDEALADPHAYDVAVDAMLAAARQTGARGAVLCSLPESLSAYNRVKCLDAGVAPLQGLAEGLKAFESAAATGAAWRCWNPPAVLRGADPERAAARVLSEAESKALLARFGFDCPTREVVAVDDAVAAAERIGYPVAVKTAARGVHHKTELGAVRLALADRDAVAAAARSMAAFGDEVLIETMVGDGVMELILGAVADPQFGLTLTVGAGGVFAEFLDDATSLLLPVDRGLCARALDRLKAARLFDGWRGARAADRDAAVAALMNLARFTEHHAGRLVELDINPLIVRPRGGGAVVADALIRISGELT